MPQNSFQHLVLDYYRTYPKKEKVDSKLYRQIVSTFNRLLMEALMETGYEFQLPGRMGTLSIRKRKGGKLMDFGHYQKTGEKIIQKNRHSHGYYAKFV